MILIILSQINQNIIILIVAHKTNSSYFFIKPPSFCVTRFFKQILFFHSSPTNMNGSGMYECYYLI